MPNLILVNVTQTLFDNGYQNCELLQKIDVSKTAKERKATGYLKLLEDKQIFICMKNRSCHPEIFLQ